ncbi:TnsA endonuclease N terminal [Methylobacterium sp. UNC300MFChir4.1]|uniref:TnsA endonuclease N-terminal domain-containing protein n=1 Tax=Methylobacterium sp. UNC300MFChir4.1 TaxID=1502747 RepID=UPI0008D1AD51|nr:TnsA endonuclease N-terminal domain-containing protein [Methylobacterium sp. UNC300MFChir4.1]SEO46441.1 TnsA endonuclease N terminal [Methylobacterium sp. UNC300MFChir4.1]
MQPMFLGTAEPCLRYEPLPSRASRSSIRPSRGGSRVTVLVGKPPREIRCESNLEADATYVFDADPDIVDILEQPPAVAFFDELGQQRHHTFDFRLIHRSGQSTFIAVKPHARVEAKNFLEHLKRIAAYVPRSLAQRVVLVTERSLGHMRVRDAKLIWSVRRHDDPEADAAVANVVADLNGAMTIADLVAKTGLQARAFSAVVRAIADEQLSRSGWGIGYRTRVWRSQDSVSNLQSPAVRWSAGVSYGAPLGSVTGSKSEVSSRCFHPGSVAVVPSLQAAALLEGLS